MILPRQQDNGRCYISFSQFRAWNELKSFNLGLKGKIEYMREYFMGIEEPSSIWAQFGTEVEAYITERKSSEMFDEQERAYLDRIKPLGVFQHKAVWNLGQIDLVGYIDDVNKDFSEVVDYKTCSQNSFKKNKEKYTDQLTAYAGYIFHKYGVIPKCKIKGIERKGSLHRKNERSELKVGENIYILEPAIKEVNIEKLKKALLETAQEISFYYKIYLKTK